MQMIHRKFQPRFWAIYFMLHMMSINAQVVTVTLDNSERPGNRPYEMVWAQRSEPGAPAVRFDDLTGWRMETTNGAWAELQPTRQQNVWERPVGRLRYHGAGTNQPVPAIQISLPEPMPVPPDADSVETWIYGNRWDWVNPPDTPPVQVYFLFIDKGQKTYELLVDRIRWQDWWLVHRLLPKNMQTPVCFTGIKIVGGWQKEKRELFFDSVRFYRESLEPIATQSRPKRNLTLFPGQTPGANTGPGRLPFPTRETTILPMNFDAAYTTKMCQDDNQFGFIYNGSSGSISYLFDAEQGLGGITGYLNGAKVGQLMQDARWVSIQSNNPLKLTSVKKLKDSAKAIYQDGTELELRLWQKSLVIDVIQRKPIISALELGNVTEAQDPRKIWLPFLNFGSLQPFVLLSHPCNQRAFFTIWPDWYRTQGSEFYGVESIGTNVGRIQGGVRYHPRTDGTRNPVFERLFLTISPRIEEVLPTVPNPVGLHAHDAVDRLWQESWGPENFGKQMERSKMLRAYGIEKLIQCNHEIAWRDGGESFTLRRNAAPGKGGDQALKEYVAHQRSLDWMAGLYSNYTDYSPVNEFWTPDGVQRGPDGNWRSAWPRCWRLKPLKAVEFDRVLAPYIKRMFNPNSAYTDVHTAVAPWDYNDYDIRMPGAGTLAQTFYAYGELLRHDSMVYDGPIFSEGSYHWMYAGLADGNYALAYNGRPMANEPLLPVFDLYQIHTKECDIGMGWTAHFCDAIPNWKAPENIDKAIDRFLLNTLAYGHIGWLVEEEFGIHRTCRSYYMLQAVQARYGLKKPVQIAYWDGKNLQDLSVAVDMDLPRIRRQLFVEYPGKLMLWLNDHPSEGWSILLGGHSVELPPAGWAAYEVSTGLLSYSGMMNGTKVDYLKCSSYIYQDGRGKHFSSPEAESNGGLAITVAGKNKLRIIHISGEGMFTVKRPLKTEGRLERAMAFSVEGRNMGSPRWIDEQGITQIEPIKGAIRYELQFRKEK